MNRNEHQPRAAVRGRSAVRAKRGEPRRLEERGLRGRRDARTAGIAVPRAVRKKLLAWFDRCRRDLPWRRTRNPYAVLVSEVMLQQTRVATVIPYYTRWMRRFPGWRALARAPESAVLKAWEGLGYYRRARLLREAARAVVREHGGRCPRDFEGLRALPGVGEYTAGAVASIAFGIRAPAVDGNVLRVLARLTNDPSPIDQREGRVRLHAVAAALVDPQRPGDGNQALMELGATICRPRTPDCPRCPLRALCAAEDPARLPVRGARRAVVSVEEHAVVVRGPRGIVLERQPAGRRWAGLWRLPRLAAPPAGAAVGRITHSVTRYRVTVTAYRAARYKPAGGVEWIWAPRGRLARLPMPGPERRLVEAVSPFSLATTGTG